MNLTPAPEPGGALHGDTTWRTADISWVCAHLTENTSFDGALLLREWHAMKAIALAAEPAAAQPVQAAPAGWKLVPIEATAEMRGAAAREVRRASATTISIYAAMLAATPLPPEPPQ